MARYMRGTADGREVFGRLDEEDTLWLAEGSFSEGFRETGVSLSSADISGCLPPARPGKLIAIGLNYRDHAAEFNLPVPPEPVSFLVSPNAVTGHDSPVRIPAASLEIGYEAELAVVIGKGGADIPEDRALEHVFGYTCANDVSARDIQRQDGQWCRCKSYPTFKPLGPWIVTDIDPSDLLVESRINGEKRQSSRTANLIFPVPRLVAFLSSFMPLEEGDVIITGTPGGVGLVSTGDVMEISIEGIGVLRNTVV